MAAILGPAMLFSVLLSQYFTHAEVSYTPFGVSAFSLISTIESRFAAQFAVWIPTEESSFVK